MIILLCPAVCVPHCHSHLLPIVIMLLYQANWSGLCNYLSSVDWVTEFRCCTSVSQYWEIFVQIIFMGIDEFVPKYVYVLDTQPTSVISSIGLCTVCLAERTVVGNGTDDLQPMLYTSRSTCLCYAPKLLMITLLKITLL